MKKSLKIFYLFGVISIIFSIVLSSCDPVMPSTDDEILDNNAHFAEFSSVEELKSYYYGNDELSGNYLCFDFSAFNTDAFKNSNKIYLNVKNEQYTIELLVKIYDEKLGNQSKSTRSAESSYSARMIFHKFDYSGEEFRFEQTECTDEWKYKVNIYCEENLVGEIYLKSKLSIYENYFQDLFDENGFVLKKNPLPYKQIKKFADFNEVKEYYSFSKMMNADYLCFDFSEIFLGGFIYYDPITLISETAEGQTEQYVLNLYYDTYDENLGPPPPDELIYGYRNISYSARMHFYPIEYCEGELRFERYTYKNDKLKWNYIMEIYLGEQLAAVVYYCTDVEIDVSYFETLFEKYGFWLQK